MRYLTAGLVTWLLTAHMGTLLVSIVHYCNTQCLLGIDPVINSIITLSTYTINVIVHIAGLTLLLLLIITLISVLSVVAG